MSCKKKKILFFVNTHFQLITVVNMALNLFPDAMIEIAISDSSSDMKEKAEVLKQSDVFSEIYFIERKNTLEKPGKLYILLKYIFFESFFDRMLPMKSFDYSELFFYNFDILVLRTLKKAIKENPHVKYSRFEEGYISYFDGDNVSGAIRVGNKIKRLVRMPLDLERFKNAYYFYEPDFAQFTQNYALKAIPKIGLSDNQAVRLLSKLYDTKKVNSIFQKKVIFLEESFSFDNIEKIDDFELILSIAETVGKENLIIKRHPRSSQNRFSEVGIETCDIVGIPWEIIQLSGNFLSKVLITISSGSVISSRILLNEPIPAFLMFCCVNKVPKLVNEKYRTHLNHIFEKYGKENFFIPENMHVFKEQIERILKDKGCPDSKLG